MMNQRDKERKAGKVMGIGISVFVLLFGIFWCVMVAASGAWFMLIFGCGFVGIAAFRLVKMIQLSKKENHRHEDPWEQPPQPHTGYTDSAPENGYCPFCGTPAQEGFSFCPKCGRRL